MAAGTLKDYVGSGTIAARPAAPAITAVTGGSARYYATDTAVEYCWDGSAWQAVGGGGAAGALTKLGIVGPLGTDQATISFASIAGSYSALLLVAQLRSDLAALNYDMLELRANGDTGGNYTALATQNYQSSHLATSEVVNSTAAQLGYIPAAGSDAGDAASLTIWIPNYAQTTFHKSFHGQMFYPQNNSSTCVVTWTFGGRWGSTAALNELTLLLGSGSFLAGSCAVLYGMA